MIHSQDDLPRQRWAKIFLKSMFKSTKGPSLSNNEFYAITGIDKDFLRKV